MIDVAVLVPVLPTGRDPWIEAALSAAERLRSAGAAVEVIPGIPGTLPLAALTICHGVQYEPLLAAGVARPVVVSDLLGFVGPGPITTIDWCWSESAADAARFAVARGGGLAARRLGFVAGPPVPTQRRVVAAFTDAAKAASAGSGQDAGDTVVCAVHLPAFDDVDSGRRAGELLAAYGCDVVAHSADAAGAAAVRVARGAGAATLGFLHPADEDRGWIASDIDDALVSLATMSLDGRALPARLTADATSGFGGFRVAAGFTSVTVV